LTRGLVFLTGKNLLIKAKASLVLKLPAKLKTKLPIIIDGEYSFPSGKNIVDDFKTKVGGKIRLYQINNFQLSANVYGVFRRFENPLVRLANFGSDLSGVIGYYKSKWFLAWEIGFDKAIVSHFKHSELFKTTIYSNVKDGWFEPSPAVIFITVSNQVFHLSSMIFKSRKDDNTGF
jgi:hypothetical protein